MEQLLSKNISQNISKFLALHKILVSKFHESKTRTQSKRSQTNSIRQIYFLLNSTAGKRNNSQLVNPIPVNFCIWGNRRSHEREGPTYHAKYASAWNSICLWPLKYRLHLYQGILDVDHLGRESQFSLSKLHMSKGDLSKRDLLYDIQVLSDIASSLFCSAKTDKTWC